jgi:hypothetical protein
MVGPTLVDIREHIEDLATDDGRYYVVCGRTGDRPVPAVGTRFPDRATARAAARATEQYRSALRRYDPQVPYYDLVVCEQLPVDATAASGDANAVPGDTTATPDDSTTDPPRNRSTESVTDRRGTDRRDLVEFCHRVAGAVFETLSEAGYDAVERAAMDAYFDLAETVGDHDELCLCLLGSMAVELDDRLTPAEQADVLADSAARLESPADDADPLDATFLALDRRGVVESYDRLPAATDDTGSVAVQVSGYALSARHGRLPVLPLSLELCRHCSGRPPRSVRVTAADDGWRFTFGRTEAVDGDGLVSAPIDGDS